MPGGRSRRRRAPRQPRLEDDLRPELACEALRALSSSGGTESSIDESEAPCFSVAGTVAEVSSEGSFTSLGSSNPMARLRSARNHRSSSCATRCTSSRARIPRSKSHRGKPVTPASFW